MLFLSWWDSGLLSLRRVHYRLVWPFSIPVDSPWNKRGIVWSGNRGLRFGIGLITGDFLSEKIPGHEGRGAGKKTTPRGREKHA